MKKSPRMLHLHRETLHRLQLPPLAQVQGGTGIATVVCPTVNNTCDFTCDLCVTGNCS